MDKLANNNVSISIIIPIYNAENEIERCIRSIYAQTFKDYEIILVNDGSKDNSLDVCRQFADKDARIKVLNKENGGSGSARNAGIDAASGKYIYFCDADDEISENLLERVYCEAEKGEYDLVVFSVYAKVIDSKTGDVKREYYTTQENCFLENRQAFRNEFSRLYYEGVLFGAPYNKLFKRDIIAKENIRFPDLRRGQDEVFNMRYYQHVNSCVIIPDALYTYYQFDNKGKNKKYRLSYFETTTKTYFATLKGLLDEFGADDEYAAKKFQNSFVYSMEAAVLLAFNPLEKLNRRKKIDFIASVINDDFVESISKEIAFVPSGYEKFWHYFVSKDALGVYKYINHNEIVEKIKNPLRKIRDKVIFIKK